MTPVRTPAPLAPSTPLGGFFPSLERELVNASADLRWERIRDGDGEARADGRHEHEDDSRYDNGEGD